MASAIPRYALNDCVDNYPDATFGPLNARPSIERFPRLVSTPTVRTEGRERGLRQLASWADNETEHDRPRQVLVCLACGAPLEDPLTRLGSLRCLECRDSGQRLDPELVRTWQANGAHFH